VVKKNSFRIQSIPDKQTGLDIISDRELRGKLPVDLYSPVFLLGTLKIFNKNLEHPESKSFKCF